MKNTLRQIKHLLKRSFFTSQQAKELGVSAANLAYYVKCNAIVRIGHGIYRGSSIEVVKDFRWEEIVNAIQTAEHGIICLITALDIYKLTEETPSQIWVAVPHETRHRAASLIRIVRMRNIQLGKTTIKIENVSIPIFDRERTIVDAFRYLARETALKALKLALTKKGSEKISLSKIEKYAKQLHVNITPYLIAMTV